MKINKFFMFIFVFFFLISLSSAFVQSNTKSFLGAQSNFFQTTDFTNSFNDDSCREGSDFLIQVSPLGCTPAVVRSDLLEEQDVYVFCEIQAMKLNPLIDIKSIRNINFHGDYPPEIKNIGFVPKYEALGENSHLNTNLVFDSIGYAVVQIRQNANESSLMNCEEGALGTEVCYLSANLTAKIQYDLEDSFGLRRQNFYLPVISDMEFDKQQGQYAFFDKRGYLRADYVEENEASLGVYSGVYESAFGKSKSGQREKQKIYGDILSIGESTPEIFLPGSECLGGFKFTLEDVNIADTTVRLSVNSEIVELREGESFLDGRCEIVKNSLVKRGLSQEVKVKCSEDEKDFMSSSVHTLSVTPRIKFKVNDEEKEISIGEELFREEYEGNAFIKKGLYAYYLANVRSDNETFSPESVEVTFLVKPVEEGNSLTENELDFINCLKDKETNKVIRASCSLGRGIKWFFKGQSDKSLKFSEKKYLDYSQNKSVSIVGFADGENFPLDSDTREVYNEAINSYDKVISDFLDERYPEDNEKTLPESASYAKVELASSLNQKADMIEFCRDFLEDFSDSEYSTDVCEDVVYRSSSSPFDVDILIDGNFKRLSLEGVREPGFEDYGAVINVRKKDGSFSEDYKLGKDGLVYIDADSGTGVGEEEYIKLEEVREDSVRLSFSLKASIVKEITKTGVLEKGVPEDFGSDYFFTLRDVNAKRVARVSIQTSNYKQYSETNFPFKIGIEKRAIQLSPEKTQQRIDNLNKTIQTFEDVNTALSKVVKGMKQACLGTGIALTAKNILQGSGGSTIARQEVMQGENGWHERCLEEIEAGNYSSEDQCYLKNADKIDSEVQEIVKEMTSQNGKIKNMQSSEGISEKKFGQTVVNTGKLVDVYSENVSSELDWLGDSLINPEKTSESINLTKVKKILNKDGWDNNLYSLDDLKKIELYSNLLKDNPNNEVYKKRLYTALKQVEVNSKNYVKLSDWSDNLKINSNQIGFLQIGKDSKELPYDGLTLGELDKSKIKISGFGDETPVKVLQTSRGGQFIVILEDQGTDIFPVKRDDEGRVIVYDSLGKKVEQTYIPVELNSIYFKLYDKSSYKNPYKNAEIKYYETEPYKGLPAIVPVDLDDGWYVYVKQRISTSVALTSYDDSGLVNSFYLCNVGKNGLEQFNSNLGDDICQMINTGTGQPYTQFPGLEESEAKKLISNAETAIMQASRVNREGARTVSILGQQIKVGSPAVDSPGISCSDYMSPKDCQILFNVCDPVICPSTRCDFGGAYPVQDVVQSGVIGSVALCLPNWHEGIYVPVCLTGVNAGIEGYNSILSSYRDCLTESLETGKTVGVCDEINSIYMCEFFWRQVQPIAKLTVPKIIGTISGQNARGGGEYLGLQAAWENAKESASFFTQSYAANSFKAFKARSTESVGGEMCNKFVSQVYPNSGGVLDLLTEADSPPQFNANFDEILMTTVTSPTMSHYKVFYHIYAGKDRGAYYKVYLRGNAESSYFQDTGSGRVVASNYIPAGDYKTETLDFTAPSGYKELCVVVNNQEECGFKEISTNFASEYAKDKYVESQFTETDIKSDKECISGTPSLYSLTNPNVQEGVGDLIDPEIYNRGIIRVCSTDNPGSGTDPERWVSVGVCDEQGMSCWLDKDSADDAFEFEYNADKALEDVTKDYIQKIMASGKYITVEQFPGKIKEILEEEDFDKRLDLIGNLMGQVYLSNHKGYLYLEEGDTYGSLSKISFNKLMDNLASVVAKRELQAKDSEIVEGTIETGLSEIDKHFEDSSFISPRLEFNAKGYSRNICYYFKSEVKVPLSPIKNWFWKIGCDSSKTYSPDPNVPTSTQTIDLEKDWKSVNYEGDINEKSLALNEKLSEMNYDEGLSSLMQKVVLSEKGSIVSGNVEFKEDKVFRIDGVDEVGKIYLKFSEGEWKYSYGDEFIILGDQTKWYSVSDIRNKVTSEGYILGLKLKNSKTFELPEEFGDLFNLLEGLDYYEGAKVIFNFRQLEDEISNTVEDFPHYDSNKLYVSSLLDGSLNKEQINNVHPFLLEVLSCVDKEYFSDSNKHLLITSLTDDDLYGSKNCDLADSNERFKDDSNCVHAKNSCHYYPSKFKQINNDEVTSLAADIENKGIDQNAFEKAIKDCSAVHELNSFESSGWKKYNDERTHYHIELSSCDSKEDIVDLNEASKEKKQESINEKILSLAKSKIEEDTYRIENGVKVNSFVCSTFVSDVLLELGIAPSSLSCDGTETRDAVIELHNAFEKDSNYKEIDKSLWRSEMKPGDIVIFGSSSRKPDFTHIAIFNYYVGEGVSVVHDGGSSTKIAEKNYTTAFTNNFWYVTHVWRFYDPSTSSGSSGGNSNVVLEKCSPYLDDLKKSAEENGIPYATFISMAYQESRCNPNADSGTSLGMMQITPKYYCNSNYGLSSNLETCKKELMDAATNIEVAAKILKKNYVSVSAKTFENSCNREPITYYGWDVALRSYVGWGCAEGHDNYVEEIDERAEKISPLLNGISSYSL